MLAAVVTPALRRHPFVRNRLRTRVETAREIVTFHLLEALTHHGVPFDPRLCTVGLEHFEAALAQERGLLIVGLHSMLSTLALRALRDMGKEATVVAPNAVLIPGTAVTARSIAPSFTYLLEVRRALRENQIVVAMVDRARRPSRTAVAVPTAQGPILIVDALIQVAVRSESPIVFSATRLVGGEFVIAHGAASSEESRSAEAVTAAFIAFLQEHVARVAVDG
jgi:lauroyl/myristoyl acyltransferase